MRPIGKNKKVTAKKKALAQDANEEGNEVAKMADNCCSFEQWLPRKDAATTLKSCAQPPQIHKVYTNYQINDHYTIIDAPSIDAIGFKKPNVTSDAAAADAEPEPKPAPDSDDERLIESQTMQKQHNTLNPDDTLKVSKIGVNVRIEDIYPGAAQRDDLLPHKHAKTARQKAVPKHGGFKNKSLWHIKAEYAEIEEHGDEESVKLKSAAKRSNIQQFERHQESSGDKDVEAWSTIETPQTAIGERHNRQ